MHQSNLLVSFASCSHRHGVADISVHVRMSLGMCDLSGITLMVTMTMVFLSGELDMTP